MDIANRISNLRRKNGISQEELANQIGVSRQAVSKWESNQSYPEIDKLIALSNFFDVTTDYLVKGIEDSSDTKDDTDANIFLAICMAFCVMGLFVSFGVWVEEQEFMATVIDFIFIIVGICTFAIGYTFSTKQSQVKALRRFWMYNIWFVAFVPLALLTNVLFNNTLAPYPTNNSIIGTIIFTVVYLGICIFSFIKQKGQQTI